MRLFRLSIWAVLVASLVLGGAGCHRKPKGTTPIPGQATTGKTGIDTNPKGPIFADPGAGKPIGIGDGIKTTPTYENLPKNTEGTALANFDIGNYDPDPSFFKANTVYFDFDSAVVKASERVRVEEVAAYLKGKPTHMVQVEGHCDERGTEEYNRALGERRALAVREYLINLGVEPQRVHTISYGEDRPAEIGSNESAWAKNRRGEFILLKPKQ